MRIEKELWPLLPTAGDEGARALIRSRPDLLREIACPGHGLDIDTLEDLPSWS
jgi:CTP:molybdopterin cytidylyltransferase MocA